MPVESSVEPQRKPTIDITHGRRLVMVALAYIPLLHCLTVAGFVLAAAFGRGPLWLLAVAAAMLYLLPPLAVLPLRLRKRMTASRYPLQSAEFLRWWYAAQWQSVFNRLPILEEALRLAPGLYSAWLRLWGAKVGPLVYWSPGVRISDRPFIEIGGRTVIGLDTKLYAHFLSKTPAGESDLYLAPICIGRDVLVGGCSLLPAGVVIRSCEQTPAARPLAPFSRFAEGRHIRTTRFNSEESDE